jgi:hypothetical protein
MAFIALGILRLFGTLLQLPGGSLHPRAALLAENLFLRGHLALYCERSVKALDATAARLSCASPVFTAGNDVAGMKQELTEC